MVADRPPFEDLYRAYLARIYAYVRAQVASSADADESDATPKAEETVKAILARHGIDLSKSFLYSDSVADTPLFEEVGHPVVINPKPAFRAEAVRRGWDVHEWKGRWKKPEADEDLGDEWLSWES